LHCSVDRNAGGVVQADGAQKQKHLETILEIGAIDRTT
jgi:hypothetical protein